MNRQIILIGSGIAAVIGYFIYRGLALAETSSNIRVTLAELPKVHSISLMGLKVSASLRVDNPSKERLKIRIPSVRLSYKGKPVASTSINDRTYTIEPVSTGKISGIMIEAGTLELAGLVGTGILTDSNRTANFGFDALLEVNGIPMRIQKLTTDGSQQQRAVAGLFMS